MYYLSLGFFFKGLLNIVWVFFIYNYLLLLIGIDSVIKIYYLMYSV